jgi:catechol 2,3-dioxygenase-like lactoylglutathione lyase family enzyme
MSIRRVVPIFRGRDGDDVRDFYVGLLGFRVAMEIGSMVTFASPGNETAQLSIIGEDAAGEALPDVTIEVADVDRLHDDAVRRGLEIVRPLRDESWGVRRFFVRDPNGLVVNVMAHVRR